MVEAFKDTDVGRIPNDWSVCKLSECCNKITDGTHDTPKPVKIGIPFLTAIHVKENFIDFENCYFLPKEVHDEIYRRCNPERNDVLMVNIGAGVATTALVVVDYEFSLKNVALLKPNATFLIGSFLNHYQIFVKNRISNSISAGGAQPFLSLTQIGKLQIALPTITEQTAISTVLNNADALIQNLEQLICKKRYIKTGVMQELMKPKEDWVPTTVEKLGKPYGGLSGKSKSDFKNGNSPYIPFMNVMSNPIIDTNYFDYVKINPTENQHKAQRGDIFFNGSSETPEEVGMCSVLLEDVPNLYLNSFCFGFRLFKEEKTEGLYLAYFFRSGYGRRIFFILAQGATRHNLSKSNFMKIEFHIPKPNEQKRIAGILRDMDNEIEELETKLTKYKMMKQGMMQSLLTGKIRLV